MTDETMPSNGSNAIAAKRQLVARDLCGGWLALCSFLLFSVDRLASAVLGGNRTTLKHAPSKQSNMKAHDSMTDFEHLTSFGTSLSPRRACAGLGSLWFALVLPEGVKQT